MSEQFEETKERNNKMETLKQEGIISFDVGLTPKERDAINTIQIEKALQPFNYYGPVDGELISQLRSHLGELIGNKEETLDSIANLVARVAQGMQEDFQQESVWVTVRITLPNQAFDVPRWHQDGYRMQEEFKLVFTIKGPTTKFAEIVDEEKYNQCLQEDVASGDDDEEDIRIRKAFETAVMESDPTQEGFATIYRVGGNDAKVHSEPPLHWPRIFMSVVAGSLEQTAILKEQYKK